MSDVVAVSSAEPKSQAPLVKYSSIRGTNDEDKMRLLNAISNAEPLQQHLGEPLAIVDLIIMSTTVTDRNTAEVADVDRTVIITEDGGAYATTSGGIIRSLNNLIAVFGDPWTWTGPKFATVTEVGPKGRQYYTIKWGDAAKKK